MLWEIKTVNLVEKYGITKYEEMLCSIVRVIIGSNRCPKCIQKKSKKKYGWKENMGRYWAEKYCNTSVGCYTYGFYPLLNSPVKKIGKFCSIATGLKVVPNNHFLSYVSTSPIVTLKEFGFVDVDNDEVVNANREVTIGNDVWIGENVIIFEGVTIGDGAVIGAGSIIRKDVAPYAVVVGVDKIVRYRFSKEMINKLLELKWWDWEEEVIRQRIKDFSDSNEFKQYLK